MLIVAVPLTVELPDGSKWPTPLFLLYVIIRRITDVSPRNVKEID